ncbi:MAG: sodium:solute symporter family protein, partial [Planctomycetota bacterium]
FIPFSVAMFPHLFQHWLTAKSARSFKLPVAAHPLLMMVVWVPCVLIGVWATSAVIDGVAMLPQQANPPILPNSVLPRMVAALDMPILGGLITAGVLAAIMSSLDSQFLCLGSIFTNDILAHYLRGDRLNDRQRVLCGRAFVVAIVAVTYALALLVPGRSVFVLGVWCFTGFASLSPLVFAAIYWRRATKVGAYACVLVAAAVGFWLFAESNFGADRDYVFTIPGTDWSVMPVAVNILLAAAALICVSLVTRPPSGETIEKFFGKGAHAA